MGRYWQPCTDPKECKMEDDKLECINKPGMERMRWCDCVAGWDLRQGWCVNKTLKESQKDDYVRIKQIAMIENQTVEDGGEIRVLVVFIQISIVLLGIFLFISLVSMIIRKLVYCMKNICYTNN